MTTSLKKTRPLAVRFFAKVSPCPTTGCWWWMGAVNNMGYGVINTMTDAKNQYAHRVAFELHRGPIPTGLCICHRCDNGHLGCVNPAHLYAGTNADNTADMVRRGRARGWPKGKPMHRRTGTPRS